MLSAITGGELCYTDKIGLLEEEWQKSNTSPTIESRIGNAERTQRTRAEGDRKEEDVYVNILVHILTHGDRNLTQSNV